MEQQALPRYLNDFIQSRERRKARWERFLTVLVVFVPLVATALALALWRRGIGGTSLEIGVLCAMYILSMIGVEVGYHRYFTHRSFEAAAGAEFILGVLGSMAAQGPLIWWSAVHRMHHGKADKDGDPHSPHGGVLSPERSFLRRFLHAHGGWLFNHRSTKPLGWQNYVKDLYRRPRVFNLHLRYWTWVSLGLVIPGIVEGLITLSLKGFALGVLWGGFVRIFLAHHFFWSLNSVCHTWGSRSFKVQDRSRNNAVVALFTLGQGWHNNHHAFPASAKVGLRWWQIDFGWWALRLAEKCGVVSRLRRPSAEQLAEKAVRGGLR